MIPTDTRTWWRVLIQWTPSAVLSMAAFCALAVVAVQAQAQGAGDGQVAAAKELQFRDFVRLPIGPKGMELSESLKQAQGQRVRIVGYMVQQEVPSPGGFLLAPQPVQMSQHADGEADDLPATTVLVQFDSSQKEWNAAHVRGLLALEGILSVGRKEASDGRVTWVRLQIDPERLRAMNSFELAGYLHNLQHRH